MKKVDRSIFLVAMLMLLGFLPAMAFAWPMPDTGQEKCYDDMGNIINCPRHGERFYGQDGNYSINPMSYTKLNGGEMVKDNVTGLIWQVRRNQDGIKNYDDPIDADNTYSWFDPNPATNDGQPGTDADGTDTKDFIDALNATRFGGYTDWRMPTEKELISLIDYHQYGLTYSELADFDLDLTTINTEYFPDALGLGWGLGGEVNKAFWSSTSAGYSAGAVMFRWAGIDAPGKNTQCFVRAVRGQPGSFDPFVINGNGTVTDTDTGLMWQMATAPGTYTWESALDYCENLKLGGYSDWRLPNIKELGSLNILGDNSIVIKYFPDTPPSSVDNYPWCYWSSTIFVAEALPSDNLYGYGSFFFCFNFNNGTLGGVWDGSSEEPLWVRAVRSTKSTKPRIVTCNPPRIVYADDSQAFGLFEGVVHGISIGAPTTAKIDIQDAGTNVKYWLSIVDINCDSTCKGRNSKRPSYSTNEDDSVGATLAEIKLLPPGMHASYTTTFQNPGKITFELGFDERSTLLTMADVITSIIPIADQGSEYGHKMIEFADALSNIDLMMSQVRHVNKAISYAKRNKVGSALSEILKAQSDAFKLVADEEQRNELFKAYKGLLGLDITWKSFLVALLGSPGRLFETFADMITLVIQTGGGTHGMPKISVIAY